MKTSLVIPAYNEEKRLEPFLHSITKYLARHRKDLSEVIVVDDGSQDRTSNVAKRHAKRLGSLRVIRLEKNQGKGAAIRAGVLAAKGDQIIFMDADGATGINELPKMLAALERAPIAIGNRWMKGAKTARHSVLRRFAGWANRRYMGLFGLSKIDTMCGFKGYQRDVARELYGALKENRWLFDTEVAYRAVRLKYKIENFPIRWESKDGSKLRTRDLLKAAFFIWPLIKRVKRDTKKKKGKKK